MLSYFSKYKKDCVLAPLLKLAEALLELFIPVLVADIIDRGVNTGNQSVIIFDVLVMVALGVVGLGFSLLGQFFSARAAVGYSSDLRSALYKKILALPLTESDKLGSAKMITTMTSDISKVQSGVNLALRLLLRSPFVVLGALIAAFIIDPIVALVFLAVIILLAVVVVVVMAVTMPKFTTAQKMLDGVSQTAGENLTGARVIRAFDAMDDEIKKYEKKLDALEKFQNFTGKISAILNPLTFCIVNVGIVALLYFGGVKVEQGILTQGAIIALYDYMSQILVELVKFANLVVSISKALSSGKRINEVLKIDIKEDAPLNGGENKPLIEFDGVCASYGGGEVLSSINLKIERGQTVGVIGGTGSGKTTLVNLIAGLYKPSCGSLYIDGKDVTSIDKEQMKGLVSIALQKPTLFKGTIKSNLLLGKPDASDEELLTAVEIAQAKDVLAVKENGLNSVVEQGGRNFSGGQRQRLSLARAIVRKSQILILDDSSSALDYVTDLNLRRALKNQGGEQTLIIVSQRTASVKNADKIIVLDDGEIVGEGTHENLCQTCEVYREINDSQNMGDAV